MRAKRGVSASKRGRFAGSSAGDHFKELFRAWRRRLRLIWFILFAIILGYVLTESKAGNWIQAAGGNPDAARARGVREGLSRLAEASILERYV